MIKYLPPQSDEDSGAGIIEGENSRLLSANEGLVLIPAVRHSSEILPQSGDSGKYQIPKLSEYYCNISTLNNNSAPHLYRYRSFWLKYRQSVINSSGGTKKTTIILNSSHAEGRAKSFGGIDNVIRAAKCVVPDHPDAMPLLRKQLLHFDKNSWAANSDEIEKFGSSELQSTDNRSGAAPFSQQKLNKVTGNLKILTDSLDLGDQIKSLPGTLECSVYFVTIVTINGVIQSIDIECDGYIIVENGTGGSGGGSGGSDPDPGDCDPTLPCFDGPGGTQPPSGGDQNNDSFNIIINFFDFELGIDPDCENPLSEQDAGVTKHYYKIWCNSEIPSGTDLSTINSALDNIPDRGGSCTEIAEFGEDLLGQNRFRLFPRSAWDKAGGIGGEFANGGGPMVAIMDEIVNRFANDTFIVNADDFTHEINLEWYIVHEIEHAMGFDEPNHVYGDPFLTPNVQQCTGLN